MDETSEPGTEEPSESEDDTTEEVSEDDTSADEAVAVEDVEEVDDIVNLIPPEMQRIKEFREILDECRQQVEDQPLSLYAIPDIQRMFQESIEKVETDFNVKTVVMELQNMYQILAIARNNETSLQNKLKKAEVDAATYYQKLMRDPRLFKALKLAESWRKEKTEIEEESKSKDATLVAMQNDVASLEHKIHNLQITNTKLQRDRLKVQGLEEKLRQMEETMILKESKIADLKAENEYIAFKCQEETNALKERYKEALIKIAAEPEKCAMELEAQKRFTRRRESVLSATVKQVSNLQREIELMKMAEDRTKMKSKSTLASISVLKSQLRKLESLLQDYSAKYERLENKLRQKDEMITSLENQIKNIKQSEESFKSSLQSARHEIMTLKGQLKIVSRLQIEVAEKESLKKAFHEKEKETFDCYRMGNQLAEELKLTELQLKESKRHQETQFRALTDTRQVAEASADNLKEAMRYSDNLRRRLDLTEFYLNHYKKQFDSCTNDNLDVLNTVRHLEKLCQQHEATIRVQDARNDSLVVSLDNLENVLKAANENIKNLRQENIVTETNHLRQIELNDMLTHLLHFTETEKGTAINEYNLTRRSVLILQKQLVQRLNKIAVLYRDVTELKDTVQKHLRMLEVQKRETNRLRELLTKAQNDEIYLKLQIRRLTYQRDLFGTKVVEKEAMFQLLEKKSAILQIVINRGTKEYSKRVMDIQLLKLEIKNLRHKLAAKHTCEAKSSDLRAELVQTHRELQLEKFKRRTIEDMREYKPHRYIYMMNKDPSEFEKIAKIQTLQRRLISKYDEITRMNSMVVSRDKQIQQLLTLLTRREGIQLAEQVQSPRSIIVKKDNQIKALLSEVNLLNFKVNECTRKYNEIHEELKNAKEEIAKQKRQAIQNHVPRPLEPQELVYTTCGHIQHQRCRTHFRLKPLRSPHKRITSKQSKQQTQEIQVNVTEEWECKPKSILRKV